MRCWSKATLGLHFSNIVPILPLNIVLFHCQHFTDNFCVIVTFTFFIFLNSIILIGKDVIRFGIFSTHWKSVQIGSRNQNLWFKFPTLCLLCYPNRQPAHQIHSDNIFGLLPQRCFGAISHANIAQNIIILLLNTRFSQENPHLRLWRRTI